MFLYCNNLFPPINIHFSMKGNPYLCAANIFVSCVVRLLAHARVESVKSKEAAEQRRMKKSGWFPFRWYLAT